MSKEEMQQIPMLVRVALEVTVEPQHVDAISEDMRRLVDNFGDVRKATVHQSDIELEI